MNHADKKQGSVKAQALGKADRPLYLQMTEQSNKEKTMEQPLGVVEPIDRRHRRTAFALLGVPVSYTGLAGLALPLMVLGVLPVALWGADRSPQAVARRALRFGVLSETSNYLHSLGHILGGKAVGAPMDELVVTATRHVNLYQGDQSDYPASTHITRAAGGPALNLLLALLLFPLARALSGKAGKWLRELALTNLVFGLIALAPIESVDGGSILHHLRNG